MKWTQNISANGERGAILVESALIMPLILFITLGIFQLSLIYVARSVLNYATYSASRAVLVDEDPQQAANTILSVISGPSDPAYGGQTLDIPGWGNLPRFDYATARTRVHVVDEATDANPRVTVRVEHDYQLILPSFTLYMFGLTTQTFRSFEENGKSYLTMSDSCTLPRTWLSETPAP